MCNGQYVSLCDRKRAHASCHICVYRESDGSNRPKQTVKIKHWFSSQCSNLSTGQDINGGDLCVGERVGLYFWMLCNTEGILKFLKCLLYQGMFSGPQEYFRCNIKVSYHAKDYLSVAVEVSLFLTICECRSIPCLVVYREIWEWAFPPNL